MAKEALVVVEAEVPLLIEMAEEAEVAEVAALEVALHQ
jgi:hypothetical protein